MRTCALTYINTNTRASQDDMFLTMLLNSISDNATTFMALRSEGHTLNGVMCGLLLFKCLLIHSTVHALNDPALIRRKMARALQLMSDMGHNITKFNIAYRGLQDQLTQCGHTFPDDKTFVEEADLDHPNEQFVRYIQGQQDNDRERDFLETPQMS
jgi:hypothetical protein